MDAVDKNESVDAALIEKASDLIHKDWLDRNASIAQPEHSTSYAQLSEDAKDKDRLFMLSAVGVYETK